MAESTDEQKTAEPADEIRDEAGGLRRDFVDAVVAAIESGDGEAALQLAGDLHEADLGALIEALPSDLRSPLIELMGSDFDFAALTEVNTNVRDELLEEIPNETLAEGVRDLESDDAVSLLEDLDAQDQAEVLGALPAVERVALQRSLDYPENSAGRLMQTTLITAPPFWTAGQILDHIHDMDEAEVPDNFFEVFVVDPGHRLVGNVFLDALVRARRSVRLDQIMVPDRRRVNATEDRADAVLQMERYNMISVPVVDDGERLVGVITIDDIVDVIEAEADEEIKALGGVSRSEEFSDSMWSVTKSRFVWLFVNLLTAFVASSVLGLFQNQIEKMVALAVLAPIVASQGGNGATQTMTIAVRALATRALTRSNAMAIIGRELLVAAINGAAFGLITGVVSAGFYDSPGLGVVIAVAMLINLIAGALGGLVVPMTFDRLGIDPAVSSGALVTTVTDVVGYFSFLALATLWFHLG